LRVRVRTTEGGPGSGNWGHASIKGQRGGSAPTLSTTRSKRAPRMSLKTGPTAKIRQQIARKSKTSGGTQRTGGPAFPEMIQAHEVERKRRLRLKAEAEAERASTASKTFTARHKDKIDEHRSLRDRVEAVEAELYRTDDLDRQLELNEEMTTAQKRMAHIENDLRRAAQAEVEKINPEGSAKSPVVDTEDLDDNNQFGVQVGVLAFSKMIAPEYGIDQQRKIRFYDTDDDRA